MWHAWPSDCFAMHQLNHNTAQAGIMVGGQATTHVTALYHGYQEDKHQSVLLLKMSLSLLT